MSAARAPIYTILLIVLVLAGAGAVYQTWRTIPTAGAPGQEGTVETRWGPLTPADRDLLIKVRLAGLWEHPVGQEMTDRGAQRKVREIGGLISTEHQELDRIVLDTARQLGVLLPNQPTEEQQGWMSAITESYGDRYDYTAVNLLRQAHGTVLPLIVTVRVGTRNELIRNFAEQSAVFVGRHIGYLESTGLVDFVRLDPPADPPRAVVTRAGRYETVPVALLAMAALIIVVGLGVLVVRAVAERRRRAPDPDTSPPGRRRAGAHRRT